MNRPRWMTVLLKALFPLRVVILAVAGLVANRFLHRSIRRFEGAMASLSIVTTVLIVAGVMLHNAGGLGLGYGPGRWLGMGERGTRAVSVEVGMRNSGLAAALATAQFGPVAALPGALFCVWHNTTGPLLASWWPRLDTRKERRRHK